MAHYPVLLAAGVTVGVGLAVYKNKDAILDYAADKIADLHTYADKRRKKRLNERLSSGQAKLSQHLSSTATSSNGHGPDNGDSGEVYEMRDKFAKVYGQQDDDDDDDFYDNQSVDTAEFLSSGMTNYYTSGMSHSNTEGTTETGFSTDIDSSYMRQGGFVVRRGQARGQGQPEPAGRVAAAAVSSSEDSYYHLSNRNYAEGYAESYAESTTASDADTQSRRESVSDASILQPVLSRDSRVSEASGFSYSEISTPSASDFGSDDEIYVRDMEDEDGESLALGMRRMRARQQTMPR